MCTEFYTFLGQTCGKLCSLLFPALNIGIVNIPASVSSDINQQNTFALIQNAFLVPLLAVTLGNFQDRVAFNNV